MPFSRLLHLLAWQRCASEWLLLLIASQKTEGSRNVTIVFYSHLLLNEKYWRFFSTGWYIIAYFKTTNFLVANSMPWMAFFYLLLNLLLLFTVLYFCYNQLKISALQTNSSLFWNPWKHQSYLSLSTLVDRKNDWFCLHLFSRKPREILH